MLANWRGILDERTCAILEEGGPIAVPVRSGDIDSVLQSAEEDILKLRAELLGGDQGSVDGWGSQTQRL